MRDSFHLSALAVSAMARCPVYTDLSFNVSQELWQLEAQTMKQLEVAPRAGLELVAGAPRSAQVDATHLSRPAVDVNARESPLMGSNVQGLAVDSIGVRSTHVVHTSVDVATPPLLNGNDATAETLPVGGAAVLAMSSVTLAHQGSVAVSGDTSATSGLLLANVSESPLEVPVQVEWAMCAVHSIVGIRIPIRNRGQRVCV